MILMSIVDIDSDYDCFGRLPESLRMTWHYNNVKIAILDFNRDKSQDLANRDCS